MSCHHVIAGDGVTAAEFATTRTPKPGDSITIIGPNVNNLGRGAAYAKAPEDAPWRYAYLLNSPARSVDADFSVWIGEHWDFLVATMSGRSPDWLSAAQSYAAVGQHASLNAPRELYGDFFHSSVREKLATLRANDVHVQLLTNSVNRIEPSVSGLTVITADNQHIHANSVDVATGGPMNQRFSGDEAEHSFPELFGNEHAIAEKLKSGSNILCIGAGAAMLDLLRFCQSVQLESQIKFTAISPNGKTLPALRPPVTFNPTMYNLKGTFEYAEDFLSALFQLQKNAMACGDTLYETRVGLRSLFMDKGIIEFVPNIIEARKVTRPLFKHFEGGTRDSIDDFNRFMQSGNTTILAGSVQPIEHTRCSLKVHYADSANNMQTLQADVVVNCAGPGSAHRYDALVTDMLARGWISICPQSGGIIVGEGGRTKIDGVRYLGPSVTSIGKSVEPVPLYDAYRLRRAVQQFNKQY